MLTLREEATSVCGRIAAEMDNLGLPRDCFQYLYGQHVVNPGQPVVMDGVDSVDGVDDMDSL